MKRNLAVVCCALLIFPGHGLCFAPEAQQPPPPPAAPAPAPDAQPAAAPAAEPAAPPIPADKLDSLVAPIALFPDDLLAQTLVASTYPLELVQLEQWLAKNPKLKDKALADAVAKQPWDPSIQSMAAVPDLVKRLSDDIQWTTELGNAFLAQQSDVMDAVQRMRKKAKGKGALESNEQQKVETQTVESKEIIVIESSNPEVIYVPSYSPTVVYGAPMYPYPPIYYPPYYPGTAFVSFSFGVMMGAAWGGSCCGCGWGGGRRRHQRQQQLQPQQHQHGRHRVGQSPGNRRPRRRRQPRRDQRPRRGRRQQMEPRSQSSRRHALLRPEDGGQVRRERARRLAELAAVEGGGWGQSRGRRRGLAPERIDSPRRRGNRLSRFRGRRQGREPQRSEELELAIQRLQRRLPRVQRVGRPLEQRPGRLQHGRAFLRGRRRWRRRAWWRRRRRAEVSGMSKAACAFLLLLLSSPAAIGAKKEKQETFETPEQAGEALIAAAERFDVEALTRILGADGIDLVITADKVQDENQSREFAAMAREKNAIVRDPASPKVATLVIGADDWPSPIPIAESKGRWRFDTKAGRLEILRRRIGANELDAIEICRGFVEAQHEYALERRGGSTLHQYAQKIFSTPGKQDGLAWQAADGTWQGPISEAIARAIEEGYSSGVGPYHGYHFKVLKGQGPSAPLGQIDFVVAGAMIGGFALAAAPADYGVTGVKSFIVSHDGVVYEKDLGSRTLDVFRSMERFDPDKSWSPVFTP